MNNRAVLGLVRGFLLLIVAANCTYELPQVDVTVGGRGGSSGETSSSSGVQTGGAGGLSAASTSSGGGQGGEVDMSPCTVGCLDPNAVCVQDVCTCNSGYVDTDDGTIETAMCQRASTIVDVRVDIGVTHGRVGNLVFKLESPQGQLFTIMNRPGWFETEDTNTDMGSNIGPVIYGPSGDQSDLALDYPIYFYDEAPTDAEEIGRYQSGGGLAICRDGDTIFPEGSSTPLCDYHPNKGASGGSDTFAAAFGGLEAEGQWRFCVGDANLGSVGSLDSWGIDIMTLGGSLVKESGPGLNLAIVDNGYDGSLNSMVCHELTIP